MKRKNIILSTILSFVVLISSSCSDNNSVTTVDNTTTSTVITNDNLADVTESKTTEESTSEITVADTTTETILSSDTSVVTEESITSTEKITTTTEETTTVAETQEITTTTSQETTTATEVTTVTTEQITEKKYIALTFDDGPNTTTTHEVLDVLEQYGIKGSFFLIGNNINDESEKAVKRAYDMGCDIGNHSKSHPYMNELSVEEIKAEIEYVDEYVLKITGEKTKFFRPPYIAINNTMYDTIDLTFIAGFGCNDWDDKVTAERRAKVIIRQAQDGGIILLHDAQGNSQTVEALHTIIPELQAQGYEFVTLTELFEIKGISLNPDDGNLYTFVGK